MASALTLRVSAYNGVRIRVRGPDKLRFKFGRYLVHALSPMMSPPTSGASLIEHMFFARPNHDTR
jgi:hypothetical protein